MLILSLVAAAGLGLGSIAVGGVRLGVGGVLFAGLAVGHVAARGPFQLEPAMLEVVRELGLILFVYTIGIQVGPGFFASLKRSGLRLNLLAASVVALGALTTAALLKLFDLPLGAALGILSGAVTNTPSLGAAQQALKEVGLGEQASLPSLGYAITYPWAIAGILAVMLGMRAVFRIDPAAEARAFDEKLKRERPVVEVMDVTIRAPAMDGLTLAECPSLCSDGVRVSRMMRAGTLMVPHDSTVLRQGDILHLVGPQERLEGLRAAIGVPSEVTLTTKGTAFAWERMVVTHPAATGRSIAAIGVEDSLDVRLSRINRAGVEIVPDLHLKLQFGDIVTVVGRREDLVKAAAVLGNSQQRLQAVHMLPMFLGILLGILIGMVPVMLPGMPAPVRLGLAGGPLVAAIVLGRVGSAGPLIWFMPPAANAALREVGIVLFLAAVG
ncbi:MAG: putative transporter, partial [Rhodospirillales bacterium]|nr:putative transporter [Rhodospirillales bacterium]